MDRRALFFVGAALLCFALIPLGLDKYRHVTELTGGAYLVATATMMASTKPSCSAPNEPLQM